MKVRNQRSVFYFDPSEGSGMRLRRRFGELYTTMFVQDIGQHIGPRGSRGAASSISIELQPDEQGLEELLTKGLVRNGYGHSLTRSVEDFIENAATQIAEFDFAVSEIVFTEDTEAKK